MPTSKCWMTYNTKAMKVSKVTRNINPTLWWQPFREVAATRVVEAEVAKAKVVVVVATMQLELVFVSITRSMALVNLETTANFYIRLALLLMEQP